MPLKYRKPLGLGGALTSAGDFAQAREPLEEAQSISEELALPALIAWASMYRARVSLATGNYGKARAQAQKAVAIARELKNQGMIARNLYIVGLTALAESNHEEAQRYLIDAAAADATTPDDGFTSSLLAALARTEYALGQRSAAKRRISKALELVLALRAFPPLTTVLPMISVLLAEEDVAGRKKRAVELYALAESHPLVANSLLFEDIAGRHIKAAAATLAPDIVEAAQTRGRALDWWTTAEELVEELNNLKETHHG